LIIISWIAHPIGLLWLGLPVVAAILVSHNGGRRYLDEHGPTATRALAWILPWSPTWRCGAGVRFHPQCEHRTHHT
jgi:hypothetical protein